jgi:hypothetical protein
MQNKANLLAVSKIPKMNISSATTVNYINELRTTDYELIVKNKPNSKPIKANLHFTAENADNLASKTQRREDKKKELYHKPWCLSAFVAMS